MFNFKTTTNVSSYPTPWLQTDDAQWICKIDSTTWKLIEIIEVMEKYNLKQVIIDFNDYTDEEIEDILRSYYEPSEFHNLSEQVVAECIGESIPDFGKPIGDYEECYNYIINTFRIINR